MNDKKNEPMEHIDYVLDWGSLDKDNVFDKIKEYISNLKTRPKAERLKGLPESAYDFIHNLWCKDDFYDGKGYFSLFVLFDYARSEYNKICGQNYHKNQYA